MYEKDMIHHPSTTSSVYATSFMILSPWHTTLKLPWSCSSCENAFSPLTCYCCYYLQPRLNLLPKLPADHCKISPIMATWLIDCLFDWSIDWFIHSFIRCFIDLLIYSFIYSLGTVYLHISVVLAIWDALIMKMGRMFGAAPKAQTPR